MSEIKFPSVDLNGRAAIVTGAGRGLGYSIAQGLANAGADIVIAEIDRKNGKAAAEKIREMGKRSLFVETDLARVESIRAMADRVLGEWGRIDILVNNAGVNIPKKIEDATPEDFDRVIGVHLRGTYFCGQAVGRAMIQQKKGKIINIASAAGLLVRPGIPNSIYAAAKAGIIMLTKSMAEEWSPYNVNVNAIAPGYFATPATASRLSDSQVVQVIMNSTPLKRVGRPEDIVGPVNFLASDAAGFITGICLPVDGGRTIL